MPLSIVRNDITKMKVGAIVNAANTRLQMGGGVCGAIFYAAGPPQLQTACDKLAPIKNGDAVITDGFALPAKYVIHTAGPVYKGGNYNEEEQLRSCYVNSLSLADENGCGSIAFPLISSGIFGYPKDEALSVATNAIVGWLMENDSDMDVSLVVFDKTTFMPPQELRSDVRTFISENYIHERAEKIQDNQPPQIETETPFSQALLQLIGRKGKTDAEVYKRANIGRKSFAKIQSPDYRPDKNTVAALAVSLELSLDETGELLKCGGFALSKSALFDVILEYFITRRKYDIYEINNVLFEYDQDILGE